MTTTQRVAAAAVTASIVGLTAVIARPSQRLSAMTDFTATVVAGGFDTPWDMEWGPDSMIWISERPGRISRLDPRTGAHTVAGAGAGGFPSGRGGGVGGRSLPVLAAPPLVFSLHT